MSYASHIRPGPQVVQPTMAEGAISVFSSFKSFAFCFPGSSAGRLASIWGNGPDYSDTNLHLALPVAVSMVIMEFL